MRNILLNLIMSLLMLAMLFFIVHTIDYLVANGKYVGWIFYPKKCDCVLPPEFELTYSESEKAYALKRHGGIFNETYFNETSLGIKWYPAVISAPTMFFDSCRAKSAYIKWVEEQGPKVSDLKTIKQ